MVDHGGDVKRAEDRPDGLRISANGPVYVA